MNNTQLITETVLSWKLNKLSAGRAMAIIDLATSRDPELKVPSEGEQRANYIRGLVKMVGIENVDRYLPNPETLEPVQIPPKPESSAQKLAAQASEAAVKHSLRKLKPYRTIGEKAYRMRGRGLSWAEVGRKMDRPQQHVLIAAKNYALKHGLGWPVKI